MESRVETWGLVDLYPFGRREIHVVPVLNGNVLTSHKPNGVCPCIPELFVEILGGYVISHNEPGWAGEKKENLS